MKLQVFCPECGNVVVDKKVVQARICAESQQCSYNFLCPECKKSVARRIDINTVQLLVSHRIELKIWHLPDELRQLSVGLVINPDDIIDFHNQLLDDRWLEDQVAKCYRTAAALEKGSD